jgi:hypothetical protein
MLHFLGRPARLCDHVSRRVALQIGAAGPLGLSLPGLLRAEETTGKARPRPRAKSVVLFYLMGGQSQLDTWDMRPDAPEGIRGEFLPIPTNVPGMTLCEHMPRLAAIADKFAIVRSMNHTSTSHNAGAYHALLGEKPRFEAGLAATEADFPGAGAIAAKFLAGRPTIPPFVQLSSSMIGDNYLQMPGPGAGFLKAQYEPLKIIADPNADDFSVSEIALPEEVSPERFDGRRALLGSLDRQLGALGDSANVGKLDKFQRRAYGLVTSGEARKAFNLRDEPDAIRDRYGRNTHGQRLLLARRLVEAGVRFVSVYWGGLLNSPDDYWDTHDAGFTKQKTRLLPPFDQCLSAFLTDLDARGLLETTLVVVMGEFGRAPKVGQVTANAGTDAQGRDHWPFCYSVVLAGGGVRGGTLVGRGDRYTAYPAADPYSPADLNATIFDALGLDPETEINDPLNRPLPISRGKPIRALFA